VCVVTLPFEFEGENRRIRAEQGLSDLQDAADVVIAIPNQKLFQMMDGDLRVADAFSRADAVMARALYSVWRMISKPGLISLDYADLHALLAGSSGVGAFGFGDGTGPDKAADAARALMTSPLLDHGQTLREAEAVLVSIAGGPELTLLEIESIMKPIREALRPDAHLAMGTVVDEAWRDRVTVTALVSEKWRKEASGQMRLELGAPAAEAESADAFEGHPARKRKPAVSGRQGSLSLDDTRGGRGRFKDVDPTVEDGENLDTPTFFRRGIPI